MQMLPPPADDFSVALATGAAAENRFAASGEWRRTIDASPLEVALRRKWLILGLAFTIAILVYLALGFATPRYTAEADVRIDLPQLRYSGDSASVIPEAQVTAEGVHTEMAALGSPRLAEKAAVAMGLQKRRDYQICPKLSWLATIKTMFGRSPPPPCTESIAQAGRVLLDRIAIGNDKMSYIIQIKASDPNPDEAALIANGFATAYVNYQRDTKIALAQEADSWLGGQLATVQAAMEKADHAVATYRQVHNLVDLHSDTPGVADTAASRHFSELNQQLEAVQASITDKQSTLAQTGAAGTGLDSVVVQSLLERHGELASSLANLRATLGENHPSVQAAASALRRNEAQTSAEIGRTVAAQNGQLAALTARRNAIAAQVAVASAQMSGESQARVKLEELQREATTERTLYESLFVRLKQVDAERRLEVANAAIVVEATAPDHPVFPHKMMMTAGAFLAALGAGVGGSFIYELASGRFQGADQVEGEIGLPVLGLFLRRNRAPHDMVVDEPLSLETEAVHAALTQILRTPPGEPQHSGRTILVTSSLPHEGKSSFSVSLGRAAAIAGHSVILLDCDLRRPAVAPPAMVGRHARPTRPIGRAPAGPTAPACSIR